MKKGIIEVFLLFIFIEASAQQDTIALSKQLDEIEITAQTVERFAGKKIYRLPAKELEASNTSLDVMNLIPQLIVNMDTLLSG